MKEKYVLEKFPRWFIFGEDDATDRVDVSNGGEDVISGITRAQADKLIAEHNRVVDALVEEYQTQYDHESNRKALNELYGRKLADGTLGEIDLSPGAVNFARTTR